LKKIQIPIFSLRPVSARKFCRNLRSKTENFSIPFKKKKVARDLPAGRQESKKSGKNFHFWQSGFFSERAGRGVARLRRGTEKQQ